MVRKKVYIRADADTQIGFGHFIRCLALADMLKEHFDCFFYTQQPTDYHIAEINKVCTLRSLPSDDRKFQFFLDELIGSEIVVLDNYFFTSDYQKAIKDKGCKLVFFGSNDRHYYADVVINFTNLPEELFSKEPYTRMSLGLQWMILRDAFYQKIDSNSKPLSFSICIGGTDQFCFAEKFTSYIKTIVPKALIKILTTDRIGQERIDKFIKDGCLIGINVSADQMAESFRDTEITLVSASSVAIEALSQGANVIAGYYVDNQINIYNTLVSEDYIWPIGDFLERDVFHRLSDAIINIRQGKRKRIYESENTAAKYQQLFLSL